MRPLSPRLKAVVTRLDARIDWERRDRGAMRVDLAPMRDLCERLGHPEAAFRTVHVAGTKAKGSVASLVATALLRAGHRTGLYTSPHVERVTERVAAGGSAVEDDSLAEGLEVALAALAEAEREGSAAARATWFDLMTAGAFDAFRRAGVEWAVVEVGLGGRLDSTNVVQPDVACITSIDLEHTRVLGGTRARIAGEKAGILKPGAAFVCGVCPDPALGPDEDAGSALARRAAEVGSPPRYPSPAHSVEGRNVALARTVLDALGERGVTGVHGAALSGDLLDGPAVRAARLPGRLERARVGGVPVVLDGAHVPSSLRAVLADLARDPALSGPCRAVVSLAREKDAEGFLKALGARADSLVCTSVESGIHLSSAELAARAAAIGLEAVAVEPAGEAVVRAVSAAGADGWVLVTGSLYLVGAVRGGCEIGAAPEDPRC